MGEGRLKLICFENPRKERFFILLWREISLIFEIFETKGVGWAAVFQLSRKDKI